MKLKIGEFARIGQISVQTVRYYADLGLLEPAEVDPLNGYRYYSLDQLPRLNRILALKDTGFSLDQIGRLLTKNLKPAELTRMMELKREELNTQVQEQLEKLERLEARMRLMEQSELLPSYEVIIKRVEPMLVASVRGRLQTYWDAGPLWRSLSDRMLQARQDACGPFLSVYHAGEPEIDAEVCAPVTAEAAKSPHLQTHILPECDTMACTVHPGPYSGLAMAFAALLKWVDANGFSTAGPDREIYLRLPEPTQHYGSDPNAITELQVPVYRQ